MSDLPEHVLKNRAKWDTLAQEYIAPAESAWAMDTPVWGMWQTPEADVGMFPKDLTGKDVIELGCGTAYVSAWLARRGARVVESDSDTSPIRRRPADHRLLIP
jgi:2-polyprenyl-3-methyl-5-hydroxy-6-metoxy-1,4-benzoquinol methylase